MHASARSSLSLPALVGAGLTAFVLAGATTAHAEPSRAECIDSDTKAQDARRDHHFSAARQLLRQCSAASCPGMVRDDCVKRLDELESAQPTIVFSVTDGAGHDLVAVKVSVDGAVLAEKLDGAALEVDPGAREFTFEVAGQPPVKQTIVIREGEKGRSERIALGPAPQAAPAQPLPPAPEQHHSQLVVSVDPMATILVDGTTVAKGRFDGQVAPGMHEVRVTEPGREPYTAQVELRDGEARMLDVTLQPEKKAPIWPWLVAGGAVVVGLSVGSYFLFKASDTQQAPISGSLGSVRFMSWPL